MDRPDTHPSNSDATKYEFALGDELRGERATKGKTLLDVQRDLRIQANYIAAIEEGNVEAFPNPSFIPGYVRSYARYLGLEPAQVYDRFCSENDFSYAATAEARARKSREEKAAVPGKPGMLLRRAAGPEPAVEGFQPRFPLAEPRSSVFSDFRLSALGSLFVLALLVGGLGYGGWSILQNIQRVQFAPVEDLPVAQAEMNAMEAPEPSMDADTLLADLESPVTATALSELYRQQELEVPILQPRDGPIAAIDPDKVGPLLVHVPRQIAPPVAQTAAAANPSAAPMVVAPLIEAVYAAEAAEQEKIDVAMAPEAEGDFPISIVAERAAWVRIYQENGTIVFEKILERGERYTLPRGIDGPQIWAGNSGSLYVEMGDVLRGPLGSGTRSIKDVSLAAEALSAEYPVVEDIPEEITQRSGAAPRAVAIQ
ncbi:helix-turn-helix domain-containing protein [Amaricoccus macauensis]|uniref:helix-turn-helix domain-containing protein n=1 Tax=Amaricoccus macauensis TaxID=57001 RepID=UPI003C79CD5B